MLFTVFENPVKRPDTIWNQVVRFKKVQVLQSPVSLNNEAGWPGYPEVTYVVVDTDIDVLASVLLLLDEASRQASTAGIYYRPALLSLDRRVQTQVLSTCQPQASEVLFIAQLLRAVFHQRLQLHQGLFDLRHGT